MRLSVSMLLLALAGMVFGAHMIGTWCVGLAIIVDSIAVGAYALYREEDQPRHKPTGLTEEQLFVDQIAHRQ